jgi:hypothetical protein
MADEAIRERLRDERDKAVRLLRAGADSVDRVEPAAAREPIRWMLTAAAELCASRASILGLPVVYALELARVLVDSERPDRPAVLRGDTQ